jgi:hypothetical protein
MEIGVDLIVGDDVPRKIATYLILSTRGVNDDLPAFGAQVAESFNDRTVPAIVIGDHAVKVYGKGAL